MAGNKLLVNEETGEVENIIYPKDKVKITREEQIEHFKDIVAADGVIIRDREPFIKVYSSVIFKLSKVLTGQECQFLNYLLQYIRYRSGVLAYSNGKPLTRNDMVEETGLKLCMVDRLLRSLQEKEVIGKHKTGWDISFTINPFIFMKGNKINATLYELYKNTRWAK